LISLRRDGAFAGSEITGRTASLPEVSGSTGVDQYAGGRRCDGHTAGSGFDGRDGVLHLLVRRLLSSQLTCQTVKWSYPRAVAIYARLLFCVLAMATSLGEKGKGRAAQRCGSGAWSQI
jgi:hypothetical protein